MWPDPMGYMRSDWRRVAVFLIASLAILLLVSPMSAFGDRDPTPAERAGIEKAAREEYAYPAVKFRVTEIKVSTIERSWAAAVVRVGGQDIQGEFHRRKGGAWTAPVRKMPSAVEADLGLSHSKSTVQEVVEIALYVIVGLVAVGIVGAILAGLARLWPSTDSYSPPASGTGPRAEDSPKSGPYTPPSSREKTCPRCGGSREETCWRCHGQIWIQNPSPPPAMIADSMCSGGKLPCRQCHGSGKVPA